MSTDTPLWVSSLTDAGVKADVTATVNNGTIGYNGLLAILTDVANRGSVTAAEFSDLKTIANNLDNEATTSSYLSYIFNAVVNGDPANAYWSGGSTAKPLGNLAVGTNTAQLNELILKWFWGGDLPNPSGLGGNPVYVAQTLPLYGPTGGPSISDINQGQLGDCYLLSTLGETALLAPSNIESMFTDNGNNTWGVRFYIDGKAVYVTVNNQLPANGAAGALLFEHSGSDIWAGLLEKAYAELNSSGLLDRSSNSNSYSAINSGTLSAPMQQVTNCQTTIYYSSSTSWNSYKQTFINAVNSGQELVIASYANTTDSSGKTCFVNSHALYAVGYDAATGDFVIRNPWGTAPNQTWETQFEASMADIAGAYGDVAINAVTNPVVVVPQPRSVGISGSTALSSLFTVSDSNTHDVITYYDIEQVTGGSIQLNGAHNSSFYYGYYEISAADLATVTFVGGKTAGFASMEVWAYSTLTGWSNSTTVGITVTPYPITVATTSCNATAGTMFAARSLCSASDSSGAAITAYRIFVPTGAGQVALNGATNIASASDQALGYVEVTASDLAKLKYISPVSSGTQNITFSAFDGTWWSDPVGIAVTTTTNTVASALASYSAGTLGTAVPIVDSAAAVQAKLAALQSLAAAGDISSITLTDSGSPTLTVTPSQLAAGTSVLADISSPYSLAVYGTASAAQVAALSPTLAGKLVSSIAVADSATQVATNLDALQTLAAAGKLSIITLTDSGTPTLAVTVAQAVQDGGALHAIASNYALTIAGTTATLGSFLAKEDVSGRGANGIAADYAGMAPTGGNSVVGFQNASFTGGYDAVVLDGPRASYAIQVAANGATTIKDIGAGDASYGQTITVSGESYLVFNGGAATTVAGLPVYGSIYFVDSPANAQLAQFYAAATQFKSSIALSGLEYWENQLAAGMSLTAIAQSFLNTSYFQTTYGDPGTTHASHLAFVETLYKNILGMSLDANNAGVQYWTSDMDNGMSGAVALISFTNATANTSVLNAVSGTTAGSGSGWLIDPTATGGYADPGLQISAQTVLSQGAAANFYNLSLVDPSTVGSAGVSAGAVTLTPGTITLGAGAPGSTVYLSASFTHLVANNGGDSIHDGPGADSITVSGTGNVLTLGNATTDSLNLANSTGDYVFGVTPGKASLAVSGIANPTWATLLTPTAPVQGASLNFGGSSPIFIAIGGVGGNTAAQVAAAANTVYVAADSAAEHVVFLGTDSGGNAQIWSFHPTAGATDHQVDANELTLVATLVGVPATSLTAAMLS